MSFAFKKFNFFQQQDVVSHGVPPNSSCYCCGGGRYYFGCDNGSVAVVDEAYQYHTMFAAHGHKVLHAAWVEGRRQLVTLGVEEPGVSSASLRIWDAAAIADAAPGGGGGGGGGGPTPLRSLKLFGPKHPESEVTALAVSEALAPALLLAVGLASGEVALLQCDAPGKPKLAHLSRLVARPESGGGGLWAVTGLAFAPVEARSRPRRAHHPSGQAAADAADASDSLWLWVVTEAQTLAFHVADGARAILDQAGARVGCVVHGGRLVVARDDALYEYTTDTRAGCTVFEGTKQWLGALRHYLVIAVDEPPGGGGGGPSHRSVSVLDARHKLLAGWASLAGVRLVVVGGGGLAVLLAGGRLVALQEVALAQQLEALFKRALHRLALDLAAEAGAPPAVLAGVRQRWGDHLYARGEYDAAMTQYLETIGQLEPSYVIRRFLDAQRIAALASYLEALHAAGAAGSDHTTLLLNAYTKLKAVDKLDAFIHRDASAPAAAADGTAAPVGAPPPRPFDYETALRVLRAAGYYSHALWVAQRAGEAGWQLDVLLEDLADYEGALRFIDTLSRKGQAEALQRYGKTLIEARPEDTTRLAMELCVPPATPLTPGPTTTSPADADAAYVAKVSDLAHLYTDRPTALLLLAEFVLNSSGATPPPGEAALYATLLQLYLRGEGGGGEEGAAGIGGPGVGLQLRDRARDLLSRGWQPHMAEPAYDPHHALLLCRLNRYAPGLLFLYDRLGLTRELLQVHMDNCDLPGLISACLRYGDVKGGGDPALWADALTFLCSLPAGEERPPPAPPGGDQQQRGRPHPSGSADGAADDDGGAASASGGALPSRAAVTAAIVELLGHIEAGGILPPLVVVQALAQNPDLQVSLVKGYVGRQLAVEHAAIAADREDIARLASDTAALRAELDALRSQPRVFQNSRCAASGGPLELPVVHFLCGHSFNLRSLGEADRACPLCAPEFARVRDIRSSMAAGALQQDRFFAQLREAGDGFAVVAEHFGRGLLNSTSASVAAQAAAAAEAAAAL